MPGVFVDNAVAEYFLQFICLVDGAVIKPYDSVAYGVIIVIQYDERFTLDRKSVV